MESVAQAEVAVPTDAAEAAIGPIAAAQRIEALDVVRGFALLGIFLMNIEFFNRTTASMNEGMPRGLTGADWLASWFVSYFVQGKFWTIFSLLFGMGFAVMMLRAEQAERDFIRVYLRRILALAVFGAAHYIFLWDGDILFTYAVAALMLMVALHGKTKPILIAIGITIALGFIPDLDNFFAVAAGIAVSGMMALYLRSEKRIRVFGHAVPLFSFLLLSIGLLASGAGAVLWFLPDSPTEPRLQLTVLGPLALVAGWLSWKYFEPAEKRGVRLGVSLYLFAAIAMTLGGSVQYFVPDPDIQVAAARHDAADVGPSRGPAQGESGAASAEGKAVAGADAVAGAQGDASATPSAAARGDEDGGKKQKKTREERAAERKAEREKRLAEYRAENAEELRVYTKGSYWETVDLRARRFIEKAARDFGTSFLVIGIFLLGVWFVRSGVIEHASAHLPFFRKLAFYGLPVGIGIGLLSSMIAMSHTPGVRTDGWGIARGLLLLGNLAACLGYVGMVVLMLQGKTVFSRIAVLGPPGRMALTNYLMQSLICAIYFHGYALGHWGMPRAQQLLFVLAVYIAQIAFSHWWLARFRYGPMEWFWRGFTYRQIPAFRL